VKPNLFIYVFGHFLSILFWAKNCTHKFSWQNKISFCEKFQNFLGLLPMNLCFSTNFPFNLKLGPDLIFSIANMGKKFIIGAQFALLVVSGPHLNFLSRAMPQGQGIPYGKHPPGIMAKKRGREHVENLMGTQWEQKKFQHSGQMAKIFL
jgi:hypothetical protein